MSIDYLFQRYSFSDAKLNVVFNDYKIKVNEIIDSFLGGEAGDLALWDSDNSNTLTLKWGEDDTNDRELEFLVNKGDRAIDLSGNLTVESASILNQDLTSDATVTFGGVTLVNAITEFSTDGTMGGNSDSAVPTEKAVVTYVAAQITAEDLDFSGDSGTGAVDLNSQTFAITGTDPIDTAASSQALVISHKTTSGNIHVPASGASAQILQYSSAGTAKWITVSSDISIADGGAVTIASNFLKDADFGSAGIMKTDGAGTYSILPGGEDTTNKNLYIGTAALDSITVGSGQYNIALGENAGTALTTGDNSVFIGHSAGAAVSVGGENTYIGHNAGVVHTGISSVFIGAYAGDSSIAASQITIIGAYAAEQGAPSGTTAIGYMCLRPTTGGGNTGIGYRTGLGLTSGTNNMLIGAETGFSLAGGSSNVMIGYQAGYWTTSSYNVFMGEGTGFNVTSGSYNFALGRGALAYNQTGHYNVAIGYQALSGIATGNDHSSNIAIGYWTGKGMTTGSDNVLLGEQAGLSLTTGTGNVFIGHDAAATQETTGNNKLYIHNADSATPLIYGDFSTPALTINGTLTVTGTVTIPTALTGVIRADSGVLLVDSTADDKKVKVDSGATADYIGAAYNDGVLRVDQNELTYADGGNFITLGLADHNTARTALGLAIGTDVQAQNTVLTELTALTDPSADKIPVWDTSVSNFVWLTLADELAIDATPTLTVDHDKCTNFASNEHYTQANITATGTIASGIWQGTAIADAYVASSGNWNTAHGWGDHASGGYVLHSLAGVVNDFLVASGANTYVKKTLAETGAILEADLDHGNIQGLGDDDHTQYILHSLAAAANDFIVASGANTYIKKTLAETGAILEGDIIHDNLQGVTAAEHIDWTGNPADNFLTSGTLGAGNATLGTIGCGTLTSSGNLIIADAGNIGSASDTDAIAIAAGGEVTLSQTLLLTDVVDAAADVDKFLVLDVGGNVDYRTGAETLSDIGAIASIVADATPQLGGDLDLNGNNIDFPTTANISDVKDEDNMASDSATMLATQQSIKAYVDASGGGTTIKSNWGYVAGDGDTSCQEAVTFAQAFTGIPDVVVNCLGYKDGTPANRGDVTVGADYVCTAQDPSTTGFTLVATDTAGNNISTGEDWSANQEGHWKCNDNLATTNVVDDSGNSNDGTLVGGDNTNTISQDPGKINKSLLLNGTDDYINITVLVNDVASDTSGVIALWAKPGNVATDFAAMFSYGDASAAETICLMQHSTNGKVRVTCKLGGANQWIFNTNDVVIANATWVHLLLQHNGTAPVLYVNGSSVGITFENSTDKTIWLSGLAGIDNANIGCLNYNASGAAFFFSGEVDDARAFSDVLTANEIAGIYNSASGTEGNTSGTARQIAYSWMAKEPGTD